MTVFPSSRAPHPCPPALLRPPVPALLPLPSTPLQATDAKKAIGEYFRGHHLSLEIDDTADLNEVELEKRLRACGESRCHDGEMCFI